MFYLSIVLIGDLHTNLADFLLPWNGGAGIAITLDTVVFSALRAQYLCVNHGHYGFEQWPSL